MAVSPLRNIGIVAHIDAGKTTVSERFLFYSGVERRMGEVHEGTATLDWMEEERRRGITITAASTQLPWRGHRINLIDTPGHVDFTVEVERCTRVLDGAILVLNAVAGVQAQTETVWRQLQRNRVACIALANQNDRAGADYLAVVESLCQKLGAPAVPVQYPLGSGRGFRAVVDLIERRAFEYREDDAGRDPVEIPIPEECADEVGVLREELVERLAEDDEDVLTAYSQGIDPSPEALRRALRARVHARTLLPVFVGAALRNVGIQAVLDAVVDYLPGPSDVPPALAEDLGTGERKPVLPNPEGPVCALAFKLAADPHEDLVFARVYSGRIRPSSELWNPRSKRLERISRVLAMHADVRSPMEEAGPGDIVGLTGCKETVTGDTLCSRAEPLVLESLTFPEPVLSRVLEPRATEDRERLRQALGRLAFEDPSFIVREDADTGQWLIAGMGELHLEVKEHLLADVYRLQVSVGAPRVEYREAVTSAGQGESRVDRVLGGHRVVGAIAIRVMPLGRVAADEGPQHEIHWSEERAVPRAFRPGLRESLELGLTVGPLFGYPMGPCRIEIAAGAAAGEHDTEVGASQALSQALKAALAAAEVALLEPLMAFEIESPAEFMGGIIGELNAKRASIEDVRVDGDLRTVVGEVPLAHMFGYATTVRSLSQGRAAFHLSPAGFRQVPPDELKARGLAWS